MRIFTMASLALLGAAPLLAQETIKDSTHLSNIINLNSIIVKGDFFTDPTFVLEVNNQEEQTVQPKNVADLFQHVNGMNFIKRGNYAIDPSFRAANYEQLNVQYNGGVKAMHACPNRMDPVTTHVLPEDIEKIEIIKGPYAVRYGANFGGVVNLITTRPNENSHGINGNAHAGYESNGNTYVSSLGLQYAQEKFYLKGNVGYRDYGNYKDGDGVEIPSAFRSTDYSANLGFTPSLHHQVFIHWRQSFGRDVLHAGLPMDTEKDDSSIFSIDYLAQDLNGVLDQFSAKVYYSTVDHLMTNDKRPNKMMMEMASQVYADTYGGKLETQWDFNPQLNLFTGVDVFNVKREGTRRMLRKKDMQGNPIPNPMVMQSDIWQDAYVNDYGIFAEGHYKISPRIVLKTGARLDLVMAKPEKPAENFKTIYGTLEKSTDTNISVHLGLKYAPKSKEIWEVAFGRGVRSANMIERYINYFNVGQDAYSYVGNPNLKPEVNYQVELGFKNQTVINGDFKINYGLSAYYSMLEQYITAVENSALQKPMQPHVKSYVNIKDAYKTGFEFFIDSHFSPHFKVGTALSYVYARNQTLDESLPMTPPFTAKFDIAYNSAKFLSTLRFKAVASQKQIAKSFAEIETPGYGLLDVEITYKPVKGLSIGGAVLNILDKTYHNHQNFNFINQDGFSRVPVHEAGRNFTLFTRYAF